MNASPRRAAVTAWEILAPGQSPAEGLVVTQASDRVKSLQFKTLFNGN
jgi:hypothetical protein